MRTCVICRKRFPKNTLSRYVCRDKGGDKAAWGLALDPNQNLDGRGYYVCGADTCQERFPNFKGWLKKCKGVLDDE